MTGPRPSALSPVLPCGTARALGRRRVLHTLGLGAVWLGAPGVSRAGSRGDRGRLRISMGQEESLCHLPVTVAWQLGYFRAEGLDVQLVEQADPKAAVASVVSGKAELASGPYLAVLKQQLQGQALQTMVLQGRAPKVAFGVSTRSLPGYRSPADLRGRRVGVAASGALSQALARACLAKGGLRASDVAWTGYTSMGEAAQALRQGELDALSHLDPAMTQLEQRGEVRVIADPRTPKGAHDVFGGPMPGTCVFGLPSYIEQQADVCQAVVFAVLRGLRWLQTAQPQDIIKTVPESQMMGDRALYLACFYKVRESYSPNGELGDAAMRTALKVAATLIDARGHDSQALLDRSHTNEFVLKARARLRA
ncbi:ABC transporter substrate-binding protein [Caldimonas brevitalea]|uniref:NitT/TauT family transport system substrate-binding protein n=1 Tax=Caldimonas brevitalea TaxID=413882 RepID=A0A0G3BHM9_9BURK|nr:ABC transporter substrate-binding protein [Caldimonas brevitalea]AKJ28944.1 NitT/TauT family transport system substrate-binding protein [Caldimonas brevitalea]